MTAGKKTPKILSSIVALAMLCGTVTVSAAASEVSGNTEAAQASPSRQMDLQKQDNNKADAKQTCAVDGSAYTAKGEVWASCGRADGTSATIPMVDYANAADKNVKSKKGETGTKPLCQPGYTLSSAYVVDDDGSVLPAAAKCVPSRPSVEERTVTSRHVAFLWWIVPLAILALIGYYCYANRNRFVYAQHRDGDC